MQRSPRSRVVATTLPRARSYALLLLLAACSAPSWESDADREVAEILAEGRRRGLGNREATAARPKSKPTAGANAAAGANGAAGVPGAASVSTGAGVPSGVGGPGAAIVPGAAGVAQEPAAPAPPRMLTLAEALETAVRSNRELISQRESLYQSALGLTGTRYAFSPRVASGLTAAFAGSDSGGDTQAAGWSGSITQILPAGGEVSLSGSSSYVGGGSDAFNSSVAIRVAQPLLRGAGRDIAWESLTQAERSLLYAIRNFELFREGFSIDVARRYYDLVQQKTAFENQRRNLEGFVFGRKQAEALFSVGRTSELEVLRARRSELTSQNSLIEAEESLRLARDRFRIFLGLPEGAQVDVLDQEPEFVPVDYDVESSVQVALENRLDWLNQREQLEDARRGVRIAKNGLLPDLALTLDYALTSDVASNFDRQGLDRSSYGAALSLSLPIQQVNERNSYRSAQIALASAERGVAQFEDDLVVSVRSTFRELERRKQSLEIQEELIVDQQRNAAIAQLRFDQGDFSNRDLVEAQEALLEARNSLIQEKVSYEIARLGLLRDLGILFIDEKGMWKE